MRFLMLFSLLSTLVCGAEAVAQGQTTSVLGQQQKAIQKLREEPTQPATQLSDLFLYSTRFYDRYSLSIRWDEILEAAIEEASMPSPMAVATATRSAVSLIDWNENFGSHQRREQQLQQQLQQEQQKDLRAH
jgi:hypothetical protein